MTQLSESLAVRVTDTRDRPVVGVAVGFAVDDGSGSSAAPTPVTTSDSGIARTIITLGSRVGPVTGRAWVVVNEAVETAFTVTALPADASGIVMVSGDSQGGAVGTVLPAPLVVRVTDAFGNPIAGVPVNWTAESGGSVSAASTLTDASGLTSVQRTLGPTAGPQTTSASATGLGGSPVAGSPVIFNHTATAGNAARVIVVDGNGQQAAPGATLPEPLVVQVLDAENNPIVNRAVTWVVGTGGGSVSPATSNTDGQGMATTQWTLGPEPGPNTVSAVVSGVGIGAFNATATAPKTSSSTSIVSHDPNPSALGQAVQVQVQVTGSGGTPTGTVNVTGEGASAPCTITLSNGTGTCSLTFNAEGQHRITATYSGDSRFNGSEDNENHRVEVPQQNSPPTAIFTPPTNCVAGQPCQFTDQSTDNDGGIAGWLWEFGDTQTSDQKDPSHTYAASGNYTVKLTVRDDDGATGQVTHTVTVSPAPNNPPVASFTHADCTAGIPCQFTDTSTDPEGNNTIVAWRWDFGDFTPLSDLQNPTHAYIVGAGFQYTVTLTVTDNQGATNTTSQQVTVQ
jgi:PKD repeat protein